MKSKPARKKVTRPPGGHSVSDEPIADRLARIERELKTNPELEAESWLDLYGHDPVLMLAEIRREEKRAFNKKQSDGGRRRAEALHGPVDPKRDAEIRKEYAAGAKQKDLAEKYNVSKARISQICNPKVK